MNHPRIIGKCQERPQQECCFSMEQNNNIWNKNIFMKKVSLFQIFSFFSNVSQYNILVNNILRYIKRSKYEGLMLMDIIIINDKVGKYF